MSIRMLYLRAESYLRRHGLKSWLQRTWRELRNRLFHNRDILYCRDLLRGGIEGQAIPEDCRIESYDRKADVPERLSKRIAEHYSEALQEGYIRRRFERGARLWCLRTDVEDIGYTWTLVGRTMHPCYYFPLMERDVYLFDALIFPSLRGRGLNAVLLNHILDHYQRAGCQRAYLEAREWNAPVIKFLLKNDFAKIGLARMRVRRGKCRVTWWL